MTCPPPPQEAQLPAVQGDGTPRSSFAGCCNQVRVEKKLSHTHCLPSSPTDPDDQYKLTEDTRQLGLVVCRGTSVVLICPQDGMEAIPNPFIQQQDA